MQARLIAYVPEGAAVPCVLAPGTSLRIGRGDDNDLRIPHASVSRRHAELRPLRDGGWRLVDLDSKNGSFVNGARVAQERLAGNAWLRFGDVHCEYSLLDDEAVEAQARRWLERRSQATAFTARIDALGQPPGGAPGQALLDHSLRAVVELAQCSRGFVLVVDGGRYRVAASLVLDPAFGPGQAFEGSHGAVMRALNTRAPVVFNDIGQEAWLADRASVARAGLRTLVALPLLDGPRLLGAIYADRREAGAPLTTLDVELLQAFAERCALWLAARREADGRPAPPLPDIEDWPALLAARGATTR
ncbi:FHA domain-containing protein [Lysobacter sp. N42]|uniref:FHA domain-containing protein n=1 Tax=Lysobacter sp. N42 TaxID=2545719 RepID=UPI001FB5FBBF|nr:FHA domain-containing protein [Lysobacter sp. N42]